MNSHSTVVKIVGGLRELFPAFLSLFLVPSSNVLQPSGISPTCSQGSDLRPSKNGLVSPPTTKKVRDVAISTLKESSCSLDGTKVTRRRTRREKHS